MRATRHGGSHEDTKTLKITKNIVDSVIFVKLVIFVAEAVARLSCQPPAYCAIHWLTTLVMG